MKIVVAACRNRGIGYKNKLPWSIKKEMQYFKKLTIGDDTEIKYKNNNNRNNDNETNNNNNNDNYNNKNAVVMGKNTWLSLKKPLPKRDNFILSTSLQTSDITTSSKHSNIHLLRSLDEVRQIEKNYKKYDNIWIIGGMQLYDAFLDDPITETIFYTNVLDYYTCDTFFPNIPDHFENVYGTKIFKDDKTNVGFQVSIYQNKNTNISDKIKNVNKNILNLHNAIREIR